jgi:hypothetical protein
MRLLMNGLKPFSVPLPPETLSAAHLPLKSCSNLVQEHFLLVQEKENALGNVFFSVADCPYWKQQAEVRRGYYSMSGDP